MQKIALLTLAFVKKKRLNRYPLSSALVDIVFRKKYSWFDF